MEDKKSLHQKEMMEFLVNLLSDEEKVDALKIINMETENKPTVGTLNEKIFKILCRNEDYATNENTVIDDFKFPDVANSIEQLILEEKIDLIEFIKKTTKQSYTDEFILDSFITQIEDQMHLLANQPKKNT